MPLPASVTRERQLGWHAVPTLPETVPSLAHTSQPYPRHWSTLPAHQPEEPEDDEDGGHEAAAAGADLVDPRLQLLSKLVVFVAHGYVLIGAELLCKGGKVEDNQSTEYGARA